MAATIELLDFLAPAVAGVPQADKEKALAVASGYRPACLPEARQDEAQAWYAAWLLYQRQQQEAAAATVGVIPAGIASEKEGDLARTFQATRSADDGVDDPMGFHAQYQRLADLCGYGAITVARQSYGCECQGH
ncbi:hypothetical protein ASL20_09700 [Cupriavidus necator]|uniref:DUF4054 domain-containing protein n=1 Tax=Cupriavidus necator TaxID=106590 RepID=UPI000735A75C|nr:DUF4054 domain-containing protein [Cupriavidus necator]KUE88889.1 hypothetical protein ASL20_09700 [Cupriavidus necator]